MNNPEAVFFDTGVLIALFNKSEKTIADAVYEHLEKLPHASRHVVGPSMVELFYKLRKGKVVARLVPCDRSWEQKSKVE